MYTLNLKHPVLCSAPFKETTRAIFSPKWWRWKTDYFDVFFSKVRHRLELFSIQTNTFCQNHFSVQKLGVPFYAFGLCSTKSLVQTLSGYSGTCGCSALCSSCHCSRRAYQPFEWKIKIILNKLIPFRAPVPSCNFQDAIFKTGIFKLEFSRRDL